MIGLIFILLAFISTVLLSTKLGIETLANDLYKQRRISNSEYKYMLSWEYLIKKIKEGLQSAE